MESNVGIPLNETQYIPNPKYLKTKKECFNCLISEKLFPCSYCDNFTCYQCAFLIEIKQEIKTIRAIPPKKKKVKVTKICCKHCWDLKKLDIYFEVTHFCPNCI